MLNAERMVKEVDKGGRMKEGGSSKRSEMKKEEGDEEEGVE